MTAPVVRENRSWNMSRIRGKDTKPEMAVGRMLHAAGFRFRLHVKDLPSKPDIAGTLNIVENIYGWSQ